MKPILIDRQTARRFILGRQGLWPGRRWRGKRGTVQALIACEAVQLDPLQATARSHDLTLHSRVLGYKPAYLEQTTYRERAFFEYGGWLAVYPMHELPYWRVHMDRRSRDKRVEDFTFTHPELFEQVRAELRRRGPLGNRRLEGQPVEGNYRGRKDTSLALFDMWLSGEVMIHHRQDFARVYDFRENVVPVEFDYAAPPQEAEEHFARKCIAFKGLMPEPRWRFDLEYHAHRKIDAGEMRGRRDRWLEAGLLALVEIEGDPGRYLALAEDVPLIEALQAGKTPRAWRPLDTTTLEEVSFLSPLDIVSARGRALKLFGFDYKWEVYTPAHRRRWGYYTLPILYGDKLVARLDPRLDRASRTLQIQGFWHEPAAPIRDEAFAAALAKGLVRFAGFLQAGQVDLAGIGLPRLRNRLKRLVGESLPVARAAAPTAAGTERAF